MIKKHPNNYFACANFPEKIKGLIRLGHAIHISLPMRNERENFFTNHGWSYITARTAAELTDDWRSVHALHDNNVAHQEKVGPDTNWRDKFYEHKWKLGDRGLLADAEMAMVHLYAKDKYLEHYLGEVRTVKGSWYARPDKESIDAVVQATGLSRKVVFRYVMDKLWLMDPEVLTKGGIDEGVAKKISGKALKEEEFEKRESLKRWIE